MRIEGTGGGVGWVQASSCLEVKGLESLNHVVLASRAKSSA